MIRRSKTFLLSKYILKENHVKKFAIKTILENENISLPQFILNKLKDFETNDTHVPHPFIQVAHEIFKYSFKFNESVIILNNLAQMTSGIPVRKNQDKESVIKKQFEYISIYELVENAFYVHLNGIIDVKDDNNDDGKDLMKKLNHLNNMAILTGDALIALATKKLGSTIKDNYIYEKTFVTIEYLCAQQFCKTSDANKKLWITSSLREWEQKSGFCNAKLFAIWCEGIFYLAHSLRKCRKNAFNFGFNFKLACNVCNHLLFVLIKY